ncbi:hypothetical protein [Paraburkholderia tropica]|uniref:hypothetical protein n=1 Tax=Paraburkholderia tropica TaxID=92647 RepID=UPI003D2961D9
MKRSGFGPRKTPMVRGSWKSSPSAATLKRRSTMKSRAKKPTVADGAKYLAACRNEICMLRIPGVCLGASGGVVPCHSNQARHGKGMGIKAKHEFTVPGCARCHEWIDRSGAAREAKFAAWDLAYERWRPIRAGKLGEAVKAEV